MGFRLAFMFLLAALPAHASPVEDGQVPVEAEGIVDVAPDGAVRDFRLQTELPAPVAALIDRAVRGWRFEPVLVDGRPVQVTTRVQLDLRAVPLDEGYALEVREVDFGAPRQSRNVPPAYPQEALRRGIGAKVELMLQLDPDGNVEHVHVEQVSLTEEPGKRTEFYRERFAAVSEAIAREWAYEPTEFHDGRPVMVRLRVPVTFEPGRERSDAEYIPGPVHPAPWPESASPRLVQDPVGTRL